MEAFTYQDSCFYVFSRTPDGNTRHLDVLLGNICRCDVYSTVKCLMSILIENGHGTTRDQVLKEIKGLELFSHEWNVSDIPLGLGAFNQDLHLFVIAGELEIEVEGFPVFAHEGAYVYIPSRLVHLLSPHDNVHLYVGLKTNDKANLRRVYVAHT